MQENTFENFEGMPQFNEGSNFQFDPIENLIADPKNISQVDPIVIENLKGYSPYINRFMPDSTQNDFMKDGELEISSEEAFQNFLNDDTGLEKNNSANIADPIYFGIKESNFDRFYAKGAYDTLGFHPYADNEKIYNEKSSVFSDLYAMVPQFLRLASTSFLSGYEAIGDLFNNEDYFGSKDLNAAVEFADAMRIGNSTRGGVTQFTSNLFLQMGFTAGVMTSVVAEEAVLFGLTALTAPTGAGGVATGALAASRTSYNIARLLKLTKQFGKTTGRILSNSFDITRGVKASRDLLRQLNNVDKAKDFWTYVRNAGVATGGFFAPETIAAIKELNSAKNTAKQLSDMAIVSKTFGGFYRDLRAMNLALSEARMEAGMAYNDQIGSLLKLEEQANPNIELTEEQLNKIRIAAENTAISTSYANTALIFATNKLTFANILGSPSRAVTRMLNNSGNAIVNVAKKGTKTLNAYKYYAPTAKATIQKMKDLGLAGNASALAGTTLRYFSSNFGEGIQEIGQEAIAVASKDYWEAVYKDPAVGGYDTLKGSIAKGMAEQFSAQGAETFLSGFLMGGAMASITTGPKMFFGDRVNAILNGKTVKEVREERDAYYADIEKTLNAAWNSQIEDPGSLFDFNRLNFAVQKQVSEAQEEAVENGDLLDLIDNKDFAKFNQIITILKNNKTDDFIDMYKSFLALSDKELETLFPQSSSDIKNNKLRGRLSDFIKDIENTKEVYNQNKEKFINPYSPQSFDKNDKAFIQEAIKYKAYEHMRYLMLFTKNDFTRASERIISIMEDLEKDPLFAKMQASDITVLLSEDQINYETNLLVNEIAQLTDVEKPTEEQKKLLNKKRNKFIGLQNIRSVLYNSENYTKAGVLNKKKVGQLEKALKLYVTLLAEQEEDVVFTEKLKPTLYKIIDYGILKNRASAYNKTLEYMSNTQALDDLVDRIFQSFSKAYEKRFEIFKDSIKAYAKQDALNKFLNALADKGVYLNQEDLKKLAENNFKDISFFGENGRLVPQTGELYKEVTALFNNYKILVEGEEKKEENPETTDSKKDNKDNKEDEEDGFDVDLDEEEGTEASNLFDSDKLSKIQDELDTFIKSLGIEIVEPSLNDASDKIAPYYKKLIERLVKEYKAQNIESVPTNEEALKSEEIKKVILGYKALRMLWYSTIQEGDIIVKRATYNREEGFDEWLNNAFNTSDKNVEEVLNITETIKEDYINPLAQIESKVDTKQDSSQDEKAEEKDEEKDSDEDYQDDDTLINKKKKSLVRKIQSGNKIAYEVKDINDEPLSEAVYALFDEEQRMFDTVDEALAFQNKIENYKPSKKATFDIEIETGIELVDKINNEYIVQSSKEEIAKTKKVKVYNRKTKKQEILTAADFKKRNMQIKKLNLEVLKGNVSKLSVDDPVRLMANQLESGESSREISEERLSLILGHLTSSDLNALSLTIRKVEEPKSKGPLKLGKKQSNNFVEIMTRSFDAVLRLTDKKAIERINKTLNDKGYNPISTSGENIAFLPTSLHILKDSNGKINPQKITLGQATNIFNLSKNSEKDLQYIKENYKIGEALITEIGLILEENDKAEMTIPFAELAKRGIYFQTFSLFKKGTEFNPLKDLSNNKLDGHIVIARNATAIKGKSAKKITTFLFDKETSPAEIKRLKKEIEDYYNSTNQNLQEVLDLQGYIAFSRMPDGRIYGIPVKSNVLSDERFAELSAELEQQVEDFLKNNYDENNKVKDPNFNALFNKEFNEKFFLTSKGGYSAELKVMFHGNVEIKLYNKATDKRSLFNTSLKEVKAKAEEKKVSTLEALTFIINEKVENYVKELKKKKKSLKDKDLPGSLKIKWSKENFRDNFDIKASAETIFENGVTDMTDEFYSSVRLKASSEITDVKDLVDSSVEDYSEEPTAVTKKEDVTDDVNEVLKQNQQTTETTSEEVEDEEELSNLSNKREELNALTNQELIDLRNKKANRVQKITNKIMVENPEMDFDDKLELVEEKTKAVEQDIKIINEILTSKTSNKILDDSSKDYQVEKLEKFIAWAKENLPDFITIDSIEKLKDNLYNGNLRVGAFALHLRNLGDNLKAEGVIYTSEKSPFKYHEAFHAVFRMLLSNQEQERLLRVANKELREKLRKEGKNYSQELDKFRSLKKEYEMLSEKEIQNLYAEEYMADEFDKFKMNPKKSNTDFSIKNFFNKLIEWIKAIFKGYSKYDLLDLYENIDSGKFKSYKTSYDSLFVNNPNENLILANAFIPYETIEYEGAIGYKSIDQDLAESIVSKIVADVLIKKNTYTDERKPFNVNKEIEKSVLKFKMHYNANINTALASKIDTGEKLDNYKKINAAFTDHKNFFVKEVKQILTTFDLKTDVIAEKEDEISQEVGTRNVEQYGLDASMIGGYQSLSSYVRSYIATTILKEEDEFGLDSLYGGGNVYRTVDPSSVYNGALKAVAGEKDPVEILKKLYLFGNSGNVNSKAFIDRFFKDTGLQWETVDGVTGVRDGSLESLTRNKHLFQMIVNGLENFRIDYLFVHDTLDTNKTHIYSAANRDDASTQINKWAENYARVYLKLKNDPEFRDDTLSFLAEYEEYFKSYSRMSDQDLNALSQDFSVGLASRTGISLSPMFVKYSIVSLIENHTKDQNDLFNAFQDREALDPSFLRILRTSIEGLNGFNEINLTDEDAETLKTQKHSHNDIFSVGNKGMYGKLKQLAALNAPFDETIGASVFKNPNGDFVYAHQAPTLHLVKIQSLNDKKRGGTVIDELKSKLPDFVLRNNIKVNNDKGTYSLEHNHLLNDPAYKHMSSLGLHKISRIAGAKKSSKLLSDGGESVVESRDAEGKTYDELTVGELGELLIKMYTSNVDTNTGVLKNTIEYVDEDGKRVKRALAPVLIRVLEASSTGDVKMMPVVKSVQTVNGEVKVTQEYLEKFYKYIEHEFSRIQTESNSNTAMYNPSTGEGVLSIGYNAKTVFNAETNSENVIYSDNERAFKFHNTGSFLKSLKKSESGLNIKSSFVTSDYLFEKIKEQDVDYLIYSVNTARKQKFTSSTTRLVSISNKKEKMNVVLQNKGLIEINESNIGEYTDKLYGKEIIDINSKNKDPEAYSEFKEKFEINSETFYARSNKVASFLKGEEAFYFYDIRKIENIEKEVEEENVDLKSQLEELGKNNYDISFEDALKEIGYTKDQFFKFLEKRLLDEVADFDNVLNQIKAEDLGEFVFGGITTSTDEVNGKTATTASLLNLVAKNPFYNKAQIYLNDLINTKGLNEIISGDQALSLKNAIDAVKRAKARNAAGKSAASSVADPEKGIYKPLQNFALVTHTESFNESSVSGKMIKHQDAQMYMTVKAFRHFWFGLGNLSANQVKLLNKVENGESITSEEVFDALSENYAKEQELLNSKKFVYADAETFLKMSAIVLSKELTSRKVNGQWVAKDTVKGLHNLRVKLEAYEEENDTVAVSLPRSASKMMQFNVVNYDDLYNKPIETHRLTTKDVANLDANYLRLQVVNPSNKSRIVDPTQIKTIITSEQDDSETVFIEINGEYQEIPIGRIRKYFNDAKKQTLELNYKNKRNLIFNFDIDYAMDQLHLSIKQNRITTELFSYLKYAQSSLASSGSSSNLLEFFEADPTGGAKYNLNNPQTVDKFEQLFMSYFSKSVFSEKLKGDALALLSDAGSGIFRIVYSVDENGMPDKHEVIREKEFYKKYSSSDIAINILDGKKPGSDENLGRLKDLVEKSNGKGVIIVDRLRYNLKEYNKKSADPSTWEWTNQKYGESKMPALSKEIMDLIENGSLKLSDAVAKMYAVRIPSQDNHSTMNVKLVDFLPVFYGSTAMFAREIVEISGADFDIDKVYTQMKEYFVNSKNEIVEYGNVKELEEKYLHYLIYLNQNIKKPGTVYNDSLIKVEKIGIPLKQRYPQTYNAGIINLGKKYGYEFDTDILKVASSLGLPRTFEEYKDYYNKNGEPYDAAVNNQYLDFKFALTGNKSTTSSKPLYLEKLDKKEIEKLNDKTGLVKIEEDYYKVTTTKTKTSKPYLDEKGKQIVIDPISYSPADLAPMEELLEELKDMGIEYFIKKSDTDFGDFDSLSSKLKSIESMKAGSASIGRVVLPNLYINLLTEYQIRLRSVKVAGEETILVPYFNGQEFSDFGVTHEILTKGSIGKRKQYILSALITVMTDNAKEMFAGKLGLQKDSLGVLSSMIGLGIPLKTAVLFINNPVIYKWFFNESFPTAKKAYEIIENFKGEIVNIAGINFEDSSKPNDDGMEYVKGVKNVLNNENLIEMINLGYNDPLFIKEAYLSGSISLKELGYYYDLANQLWSLYRISYHGRNINKITTLSKSAGKDFESIKKLNDGIEELGIFKTDKEFYKPVKPSEFVPFDVRSLFRKNSWLSKNLEILLKEMYDNLIPKAFLREKPFYKKIVKTVSDTLYGYEAEAAVNKDLLSYLSIKAYMKYMLENKPSVLSSLTNDALHASNDKSILKVIERLKNSEGNEQNFFLNRFLIVEDKESELNKNGYNVARANTLSKVNPKDKLDIQTSFMSLYMEPSTREDAIALVHYMMVKDGLQLVYGSMSDALTPSVLGKYFEIIDSIQIALDENRDSIFKEVFGLDKEELYREFVEGYVTASRTTRFAKKINVDTEVNFKGSRVEVSDVKYTIKEVRNNPNTLYVFADNDARLGLTGDAEVRREFNAFGLPIKKNNAYTKDSYYSEKEIIDFENSLQKAMDELIKKAEQFDKIVFPKNFLNSKDFKAFSAKGRLKSYALLTKAIFDTFNYDVSDGFIKREVSKEQKAKKNKSKAKAVLTEYYSDAKEHSISRRSLSRKGTYIKKEDGKRILVISPYLSSYTLNNEEYGVRLPRTKDVEATKKNFQYISKLGEELIKYKDKMYKEFNTPYILKHETKDSSGKKIYSYFRLTKIRTINPKRKSLYDVEANTANYAEYEEFDPVGPYNQTAVAFLFDGNLPTYSEIREEIAELNAEDDGMGIDLDETDSILDSDLDDRDDYKENNKEVVLDKESENALDLDLDEEDSDSSDDSNEGGVEIDSLLGNSFEETEEDEVSEEELEKLKTFWEENRQELLSSDKFIGQGLTNFEKFKAQADNFDSYDVFIEHLKNCYL